MKVTVKNSGIIKLTAKKDPRRGNMFVAEARKHIPFPIRRVYFVSNIPNTKVMRGGHAHKKLTQVVFCLQGSLVLNLDDGKRKQHLALKNPSVGVILGPRLWHTMSKFSKDCVMLVLASDYYKERDYVRSYKDFLKLISIS